MATNIPTNTPLQQQIDEFIAEGASWQGRGTGSGFHPARRTRHRGDALTSARARTGRHGLLSWPVVSVLPSGVARLSTGLAAHAGKGCLPGGDFPADAGPQQSFGRKAGTDLCALER